MLVAGLSLASISLQVRFLDHADRKRRFVNHLACIRMCGTGRAATSLQSMKSDQLFCCRSCYFPPLFLWQNEPSCLIPSSFLSFPSPPPADALPSLRLPPLFFLPSSSSLPPLPFPFCPPSFRTHRHPSPRFLLSRARGARSPRVRPRVLSDASRRRPAQQSARYFRI
jgi:hypothetical protein